ncbi:MAG: hypothetical protein IPL79_03525 [Myxococcales bacterium]|nr:hypothetical protein [Myxococcales bacterium]
MHRSEDLGAGLPGTTWTQVSDGHAEQIVVNPRTGAKARWLLFGIWENGDFSASTTKTFEASNKRTGKRTGMATESPVDEKISVEATRILDFTPNGATRTVNLQTKRATRKQERTVIHDIRKTAEGLVEESEYKAKLDGAFTYDVVIHKTNGKQTLRGHLIRDAASGSSIELATRLADPQGEVTLSELVLKPGNTLMQALPFIMRARDIPAALKERLAGYLQQ